MKILSDLLILGVLFILAGFFATSETALFSLSKIEKRRLDTHNPLFSRWVKDHLSHPRRTLITILIGNMLVHVLASSMVTLMAMDYFGVGGVGLTLVLFTVLLIIFGEIFPKVVAVRNNESLALATGIPLKLFSILFYPFRFIAQKVSDRLVFTIAGHKKIETSEQISQEELKVMINIGEKEGILDRQERKMIHKLFELGERPVKDIMIPRIDAKALNAEDTREEHIALIQQYHFSHFPVYQESRDNILGVVSAQQYMLHPETKLDALIHQPLFVPETKRIDEVLNEFKAKNENFAVCVDEYGGTAGIVTLEDILEEIFGEFYDEYAEVENPIRPHGHGEYLVEAKISLSDFNEHFGTSFKTPEASTLGGFIIEKLGEIPAVEQILNLPECEIRIHQVIRKRRIHRVIVRMKR